MKRTVALFCLYLLHSVSGEPIIRVLFNNGVPLPTNQTCNFFDNLIIDEVLDGNNDRLRSRRQLRAVRSNESPPERQLWPAYCKNNCAGFAQNTCRATGCKGYRRRILGDKILVKPTERELLSCTDQIPEIDLALDDLVARNQVSASCRAVLRAPRNMTCYDDVIHGEIEYVKVWDLRNVTILDGKSPVIKALCKSPFYVVDIRVNSCVDFLETVLTAPDGKVLVSNSTISFPYWGVVDGALLNQKGIYNLTATPDGFDDKMASVSFEIRQC